MAKDRNVDERPFCGKFKSIEDLEKAYSELIIKFGDHGREVGSLKRKCRYLEAELNKLKNINRSEFEKGEQS